MPGLLFGFLSHDTGMKFPLFLYVSLLSRFLGPLLNIFCSYIVTFTLDILVLLINICNFWWIRAERSRVSHQCLPVIIVSLQTVLSLILIFFLSFHEDTSKT